MAQIERAGLMPLQSVATGPQQPVVTTSGAVKAPGDRVTLSKTASTNPITLQADYNALAVPISQTLKTLEAARTRLGDARARGNRVTIASATRALNAALDTGNAQLCVASELRAKISKGVKEGEAVIQDSPTTPLVRRLTIATNNGANLMAELPPATKRSHL